MALPALLLLVVAVLLLAHLAVTLVRRRRRPVAVRDERLRAGDQPADSTPAVVDPSRGPLT